MSKVFEVDIKGVKAELPILPRPSGINIAFFNLHGNAPLTEHCGKELAKLAKGCDVLLTAESKGLQLTHVVARELGMTYYAVARKSKKLYMQDGVCVAYGTSITTGKKQEFYLSKHALQHSNTTYFRSLFVSILYPVINKSFFNDSKSLDNSL